MGVILKGPMMLGRTAEVRYTASGDAVTELSMAYNFGKRGADGKKPTQWIACTLWGDRGPKMLEWLLKGTCWDMLLEDVHIETYQKRDGSPGHKLAARVSNIDFIPGCDYGSGQQREGQGQQAAQAPAAPAARPPVRQAPPPTTGSGFDDMDDDIPF